MRPVHVSSVQRRRLLVRRHLLDRSGTSPRHITNALVAVHATDPATPYLSILARTTGVTLEDIAAEMYERRLLVRWLAMRRTVFLLDRDLVPDVHAAVSAPLADVLRRRLVTTLEKNQALPDVPDVPAWVRSVERDVRAGLREIGDATGAQLSAAVPGLKTPIPPRLPSDTKQTVTSSLLALMSAAGEIVRGTPVGAWTTRQHRWQAVEAWWEDGVPPRDALEARTRIARRWLQSYGPATVDDLQWWTGWTKTATRATLTALAVVDTDLDGIDGIDLPHRHDAPDDIEATEPVAALLPSLDSTAMGWRHRHWYSPADTAGLYDSRGNVGPTIWWDGRIVGVWASTPGGVRTRLLEDLGADGADAIGTAAADLEQTLGDTVVTPSIRAPLEQDLSQH
ncbi:winged helix DNA-binding domain-containing protein [Rathayibacter sp. VKM Ac-2926]|uniref:winged helix DNA-binding domain-containing protein n=1 Tax=Rathayibacter sp. VKM Ac-2926 TaxID=2929477 RepID=UPI001FB43FFA|nr:winged helix DNA-binding domain-containing protein [Rathayibacter sp. VKM Ac-2926]MCJ1705514.1 winged helix DNA-binding domain-containing protein [Rathayibacter sp. VKM Ac-2926]